NPHFWYDLPQIPAVAGAIESALAGADPGDRAAFAAGRQRVVAAPPPGGRGALAAGKQRFVSSLAPLDRVVTSIRKRYPGAPVAYTERVPAYLLEAADLNVVSPPGFAQAIEDGDEPSALDTQAMDDLISGRHVRVLLYNAQATSPVTDHVRDLARRSGVPVVAVTETQPRDAVSFQAWQLAQLTALLHALGG